MYCSMPKKRNLKLNKLNKISGLSRWEAKATKREQGLRIGCGSGRGAGPYTVPGHPIRLPVCVEALRPGSRDSSERANMECQDSLLPWGISLELVPLVAVAVLPSGRAQAAVVASGSVPAVLGSASSEPGVCSCCRLPQLALFSPRWPSMVWDTRVSEKRAHSANRGSTTYVMKPGGTGGQEADSG